MICNMRCVNAFFIDITNIFVNVTDFSCHFNQIDGLRLPNECLCVILTYYFFAVGAKESPSQDYELQRE